MPLHRLLQKFSPGRKLAEIQDLESLRIYYVRLMLLLGIIAVSAGFLFSVPTYLSEHLYGMIYIHVAIVVAMVSILWFGSKIPQVPVFFMLIYGITLTLLAALGPYGARPAWLIMSVVTAAFLYGRRAAIGSVIFNLLFLLALYAYAPPYLPAWNAPHQETLNRWLMFCGNFTLLSLISTLPATFLLNRMSGLLTQEKNFTHRLAQESKDLQTINAQLEKAVSDRIRAEEESKRLQTELLQVQKMEAMGTLAGGITHDFNNILSAVIGYGQLVQADPTLNERSAQNIEKLLKSGERGRVLVQQILTFSRKIDASVEPLDLADSISDALRMMRALIPANVQLQKNLAESCTVMSNSTHIYQILMNLCTNAVHAMGPDGGTLDIELTGVMVAPAEASDLQISPGGYARISVHDTGRGIPPDIIGRIFEPYFTTKGIGSGTGLGLSVVHGIVKSHQGAVTCRSIPGQGTTFTLYLPRTEKASAGRKSVGESEIPTGTETILFVDDEAMLADTSSQILNTLGYSVVAATSSTEALKIFSETPDRFDAVITDMAMPHLTGDKLTRKILDIRPDMPVIICTGYSEYISNHDALQLGIREFLMKPYTIDELAGALRRAVDGKNDPEEHNISSGTL